MVCILKGDVDITRTHHGGSGLAVQHETLAFEATAGVELSAIHAATGARSCRSAMIAKGMSPG